MKQLDVTFEELIKDYYTKIDNNDAGALYDLLYSLLNKISDSQVEDARRNALKIKDRYHFSTSEFRLCMKDLTAFFAGEYLFDIEYVYQVYSYAVNENEDEHQFYKEIKDISVRIDYEEYLEKLLSHPLEERLEILGYGYVVMCFDDNFRPEEITVIKKLLER